MQGHYTNGVQFQLSDTICTTNCHSNCNSISSSHLNNWTTVSKKRRLGTYSETKTSSSRKDTIISHIMPPDQMEPVALSTALQQKRAVPDTSIYRLAKLKYGKIGSAASPQSQQQIQEQAAAAAAAAKQAGVKRKVQEEDAYSAAAVAVAAAAAAAGSTYSSLHNVFAFKQPLPAPVAPSTVIQHKLAVTSGNSNTSGGSGTAKTSSNVEGDYNIMVGETLRSLHHSYEVVSFLGRGTFGQVVKAWRKEDNTLTAVKILKNHPSYARQGHIEIQILQQLSKEDTAAYNLVRALECFSHKNHMCLVFELLEQNLYDYLKSHKFRPLQLKEIRPITQQVLTALSKLRSLGLIHADLKPENIMLVNPNGDAASQYRVKVIDFGSACYAQKAVQSTYLQSRYYRAPEILLGLPFTEAIDMWSLGCVIAELFLGWPLYPGSSEYDQIRYITETQGFPSNNMLKLARKTNCFFTRNPYTYNYELKSQEQNFSETRVKSKEARKYILTSLEAIIEPSVIAYAAEPPTELEIEREDRLEFVDLLQRMLELDSKSRIRPDTALQCTFISMAHLHRYPHSKRRHESETLMKACYTMGRANAVASSVVVSASGFPAYAVAPPGSSPSVPVSAGTLYNTAAAESAAALHPLLPTAFNTMYSGSAAAAAAAADPFGGLCMLSPQAALALQTGYQHMQKAAALRAIHFGAAAAASAGTVQLDAAGRYLVPVVNPYPSLGPAEVAWDQAFQYAAATAARQRAASAAAAAAAAYASVQLPSHMYGTSYVNPPGAFAAAAAAAAAAAPASAVQPGHCQQRNLTLMPSSLSLHHHHQMMQQQQQHQLQQHQLHQQGGGSGFMGNEPIVISDSDDDSTASNGVVHRFAGHILQGMPVHAAAACRRQQQQQSAVGREKRAVAVCAPFSVKEEPCSSTSVCPLDLHHIYGTVAAAAAGAVVTGHLTMNCSAGVAQPPPQYVHSFAALHRPPQ